MKRKLYNKILEWKETDKGQTALLIDGARRVGKSYIAEAFAKAEYKSYILIDFNHVSKEIKDLFDNYLEDLDSFFMYLSAYYNVKLYERETLIFLMKCSFFRRHVLQLNILSQAVVMIILKQAP